MSSNVRGRLEALVLLVIGLVSLWFASRTDYDRLMNPSFRWVTLAGAALVTAMGLALAVRPRRDAGAGALLVFAAFFAIVIVGRPFSPGVTSALGAGIERPPAVLREGYGPLATRALFERLDEEVADIPEGAYVMGGFVYRTADMDRQGVFILLEPLMACCLADAIAFGVRVKASEPLPDPESWNYVYGRLKRLETPVATPRFRVGAVLFTNVSRTYRLDAEEIASFRSLLADVVEQVPPEQCSLFRDALETTGLAETLRGDEEHTVFAPLDLVFERMPEADRAALFGPESREQLRAVLMDFVVKGRITEEELFGRSELTALSGRTLPIEVENGQLRVAGARILLGNRQARNGLLHIVHPGWISR